MIWQLKSLVHFLCFARCPNCESAWTGGNANSETIKFCIVCGSKDGRPRGFISRFLPSFIHRTLVSERLNAWQDGFNTGKKQ